MEIRLSAHGTCDPPGCSASGIIGEIKAHTSRMLRKKFESVKKNYRGMNFDHLVFFLLDC